MGGGSRAKVVEALKTGPADVVVLPTTDMADLPNVTGMAPLGRITVGVAVKAGDKVPDISTPEKFRAALLAAKGVAYADPAAGTSAGKVIDSMLSAPEFKGVRRVPVRGPGGDGAGQRQGQTSRCRCCRNLPPTRTSRWRARCLRPTARAWISPPASPLSPATPCRRRPLSAYLADPKNAALWRKNGLEPLFH